VARGVDDVADLQVLVEIDEFLALGVRKDRPGEVDLCLGDEAAGDGRCRMGL